MNLIFAGVRVDGGGALVAAVPANFLLAAATLLSVCVRAERVTAVIGEI